jgi:hypothetical protein
VPNWQARAERTYHAIQAYYTERGGTQWSAVSADPRLFNRVWRNMLRLPKDDMPPPAAYRQ